MAKFFIRGLLPSERMRIAEEEVRLATDAFLEASRVCAALKNSDRALLLEARAERDKAYVRMAEAKKGLKKLIKRNEKDIPDDIAKMLDFISSNEAIQCIHWTGNFNLGGYGLSRWRGRRQLAHRLAYALANKVEVESLEGWIIRHQCDNPACINAKHLLIGTTADNNRDMYERGRAALALGFGETSIAGKLKSVDIPIIRERIAAGERKSDIAKDFGVNYEAIRRIGTGETWKHLPK